MLEYIFLIILLIIIIFSLLSLLLNLFIAILIYLELYNQDILYYDFGNKNSNIKICFLAGVHGNEPAGVVLLQELVKNNYFKDKNIFIRVIPLVNNFGYKNNIRYQNDLIKSDINRNFEDGKANDKTSEKIINLTKEMNLIIDFHEGWGFHKINDESIGSTVITGNFESLAKKIIENINKNIKNEDLKFVLLKRPCNIESSFGCYNYKNNKKYILIETSGQNNIQKMEVRKNQVKTVIDTVLDYFNES